MKRFINFIKSNYVLFLVILLSLTPTIWFIGHKGQLISGVDINFPLNPIIWLQKRLYVWNDDLNAGLDFSSSIAGIFFHTIQVAPYLIGFDIQLVQIISLIFWFGLIVFSSFYFIKTVIYQSKYAQLVFVVSYSFNIYLFNSWENIKVANLSLVAAIPLFLGIYNSLISKRITLSTACIYTVVLSFIVSGSGINPAYFITFFIAIFIYFISNLLFANSEKNHKLIKVKSFIILCFTILFINTYWILPTINYIFVNIDPSKSIDKVGFNNWVDSLSANSSLLNIMRIQGAWDWYALDGGTGEPLYIPYALNYFYNTPFILFSFLLPLLLLISLIYRKKNYMDLYITFGVMFVFGVFMGAGTHLPTGKLYRFLLDHLPFFSLFRSPWYIFTPLVTFSISIAISLLVYKTSTLKNLKHLNINLIPFLTVVIFLVGYMFYSYPLISGKIFRPVRDDGFYISFPNYVFETSEWLKDNDNLDRILIYPDEEIEKFDWKYRAVESIIQLISDREFLFLPLNAPNSPTVKMIKEIYLNLKTNNIEAAEAIANKLNVNTLYEKTDQSSLSPDLPDTVKKELIKSIGKWNFYRFPSNSQVQKIYSPLNLYIGSDNLTDNIKLISITEPNDVIVNPIDSEFLKIPEASSRLQNYYKAVNMQYNDFYEFAYSPSTLKNRFTRRDLTKARYELYTPKSGLFSPVLERYNLEQFGISTTGIVNVKVNSQSQEWSIIKINNSFVYFDNIFLEKGNNIVEFNLVNENLVNGGDFKGSNEFKSDPKGEFKVLGDKDEEYLSILNNYSNDTAARFALNKFDPSVPYYIQVRYRQIYGNNASVIIGQNTPETLIKVQIERLPNYPEWNTFGFYYEPVLTNSKVDIGLIAPETKDPLGTKVFYDDLFVQKVFSNNLFFINTDFQSQLHQAKIEFRKISPVQYEGSVKDGEKSHLIVFSENYSKDWEIMIEDNNGVKISNSIPHFTINTYANAWYMEGYPSEYRFTIKYKPQKLFYSGVFVTAITVVIIILYFIISKFWKKEPNE